MLGLSILNFILSVRQKRWGIIYFEFQITYFQYMVLYFFLKNGGICYSVEIFVKLTKNEGGN